KTSGIASTTPEANHNPAGERQNAATAPFYHTRPFSEGAAMSLPTLRDAKGSELADRGRVLQEKDGWAVFSLNGPDKYRVVLAERSTCSCADWELRQADCKHILAVKLTINRQASGIDFPVVTDAPPIKFPKP